MLCEDCDTQLPKGREKLGYTVCAPCGAHREDALVLIRNVELAIVAASGSWTRRSIERACKVGIELAYKEGHD